MVDPKPFWGESSLFYIRPLNSCLGKWGSVAASSAGRGVRGFFASYTPNHIWSSVLLKIGREIMADDVVPIGAKRRHHLMNVTDFWK